MEHPPFAPGLKATDNEHGGISLDAPVLLWQACVHRCAWLDEASKGHHAAAALSARMYPLNPDGPTSEECREMSRLSAETAEALKNAEAWRLWALNWKPATTIPPCVMGAVFVLLLLISPFCPASEFTLSREAPPEVRQAICRVQAEYKAAGAALPKIHFIWATQGQCEKGAYGEAYARRTCWVVLINATDFTWPRWEISLDKLLLHECGHTLGWGHSPADSVMESVCREHLLFSDLSRIQDLYIRRKTR